MARTAKLAGAAALCAAGVAWILWVRLYEHGGRHPVRFTDLSARLIEPRFPQPAAKLFRSATAFDSFLHDAMPGRPPRAPSNDFRLREAVLVTAGPRSSTGYSLDVLRVTEERGRIVVLVREQAPRLGDPVQARVTYPYRLITLPESRKPVEIDWQGRP